MFAASKTSTAISGYQISRSLRFNSADSAYLNRTPASAGNRKTYTISVWCKRASTEGTGTILNARTGAPWAVLAFSTGDGVGTNPSLQFSVTAGSSSGVYTNAVFRDVSAWYHIICAVDTTQATASNRVKIYINSVLQDLTSGNYPTLNQDTQINSTIAHEIGNPSGYSNASNFYLTEYNFIDGQALTPSSFGETNAQTGVWQPKAYSGSYGTNGFYLNFSDNSNTTAATLGKDYSGNGNNWTPNNFSVTAGAGNDSLVDSPTSYGTDTGVGGEVRGNYATFNPLSTTRTISNGNLYTEVTGGGGSNVPISSSMALPTTGKWYWEITAGGAAGGGNGGWDWGIVASSTPNFRLSNLIIVGTTGCYGVNGNSGVLVSNATSVTTYISGGITGGAVAQVAYDADAGKLWLGKNNTWGTNGGVGNPAAGTNAGITGLSGEFIPMFEYASDSGLVSATLNMGQRPFAYTAPSGFKALCTQNLPTPTIGATSTTLAGKFFNPVLYTGNGSTQSITDVGFQPDFTWLKCRSAAEWHSLFDSVRGVLKNIRSNSTNAEVTATATLTAFNSNGFSLGADPDGYGTNTSGRTYVAWNWRASNATAVTNTSGSITSTVSASTTSGFSIVTYTGTYANATVGHGLGVAPSLIFGRSRTTAGGWPVYSAFVSNPTNSYLVLNTTDAVGTASNYWGTSAPTSTTFSLSTYDGNNKSGDAFVMYCFAPIAGYSAFGSYTGNGSADGPFVFTGMRPAYVMIKRSSAVADWYVLDVARNTYNAANLNLYPNLSNAEGTFSALDILSNGFKIRNSDNDFNASGGTYIYMAFASNPFKTSLAR